MRLLHCFAALTLLLVTGAGLTACSSSDKDAPQVEEDVDLLYNKAAAALDRKEYAQATQ